MSRRMNYDLYSSALRVLIPKSNDPRPLIRKMTLKHQQQAHYYMNACGIDYRDDQTICLLALKKNELIFEYYRRQIHPGQSIMLFSLSELVLKILELCIRQDRLASQPECSSASAGNVRFCQSNGEPGPINVSSNGCFSDGRAESSSAIYQSVTALSEYSFKKLWDPLGMEHEAYWNVVRAKNRLLPNKYILSATAVDVCKLVYFAVNGGCTADGVQLLDVTAMQLLKTDKDNPFLAYRRHHSAPGSYGNLVYVNHEKEITVLRLGTGHAKTSVRKWIQLMEDLCEFW